MKSPKRQNGFSLTELMVAVTIGMIVLAGVSSVMVSNKKTYTAQDSLARLQENARTAMLMLTYEMRNIGYWGCNPDMENVKSALKSSTSIDSAFWFSDPMEGADAPTNASLPGNLQPNDTALPVTPRAGTDVFLVRGLDTSDSFELEGKMNNMAASLRVTDDTGIAPGEVLVVTDCNSADIFQVNGITGGGGFDNLIHNGSGNATPGNATGQSGKLSKTYSTDAKIMRYKANLYYIDTGASGEPSLFRRSLSVTASTSAPQSTELVEGIENLQILYGVDENDDKLPDSYKRASLVGASSWANVVSIRFGIIARALANLQTTDLKTAAKASQLDTKALDVDGDGSADFTGAESTSTTQTSGSTALDRQYQRRMFRTTVLLRNLQN